MAQRGRHKPPAPPPGKSRLRRWAPALAIGGLAVAAAALHGHGLDRMHFPYFDESYYLLAAHQMNGGVWEDTCGGGGEVRPVNYVHPPLAKLMMALSVHVLDTANATFTGCRNADAASHSRYVNFTAALQAQGNPWAWRLPSAAMGTVTVAFAALAARRLLGPLAGVLAGAFVLLDGLVFTSSRMALLDIFATGFCMVALWCATWPTRWGRVGAGAFLGLGFASKFPAAFAGPAILLVALWCHHRERTLHAPRVRGVLASLLALPAAVWLASYAPWWGTWVRQRGMAGALSHWVQVQVDAVRFEATVTETHSHASPAWAWFSLDRPVLYVGLLGIRHNPSANQFIYGIGNPVVWWGAVLAVAVALALAGRGAWRAWRGRTARGGRMALPGTRAQRDVAVACLLPVLTYLPFLAIPRNVFLYYMTLVVPLLAIALAGALAHLWRRPGRGGKVAGIVTLALAVAAFVHYLPLLDAGTVTLAQRDALLHTVPWMRA